MKKYLSLMLVLIMLASCLVVAPMSVSAANGIETQINSMLKLFPSGSYFTANGQECGHLKKDSCKECYLPNILARSDLKGLGYKKDVDYTGSYTCVAFANFAFRYIYGKKFDPNNYSQIASGSFGQSVFANAKKGDIIGFYNNSGAFCHYAVYIGSANSNNATFYQANFGGTSQVNYGSWSYSDMKSYYGQNGTAKVFRAKNYDQVSGETHTTHSYDTYVYYWDSHPHYKCYKCSCGEIKENRNELTYVESCKDCQAHTCDQKIYYSYWAAHPHYYLYKCSLCGKASEDFSQKKYIDSCKDCQEHTCNQEVYYSYWDAHPHYYLYKCSLCGKESADYSQTKTISGCEYCYPGKPTIIVDFDTFNSSVSFYWGSTINTDNYTLHLYDVDNNYKYPLITNITDLHYKLSLPVGNYTVQLASINEELRGTNRWYTMSDIVEFSVINKPLIMIGDTDSDGKVTIKDATTIQKHVAGITTISDEKFACADIDKDGKISVKDATRIQKFLAGIISSL